MTADPAGFTYPGPGLTRDPAPRVPPGYHLLVVRTPLGEGRRVRDAALRALTRWDAHRAAGLTVPAGTAPARPGVTVALRLGAGPLALTAPCRVVWARDDPPRAGFAYGTLPGHPVRGEEAFTVEQRPGDPAGPVWLTVTAVSRGAAWYTRAAGPAGRAAQRAVARRYGRALRRAVAGAR
jgi:uncharacterized protein (UPF0548 family)